MAPSPPRSPDRLQGRPRDLRGPRRPNGRPPSLDDRVRSLLVVVVAVLYVGHLGAEYTCGPGLITPGMTVPQGDVILEDGDTLELYCILNLTHPSTRGRNASHLVFTRGNANKTVGSEYLSVVNETTLKLTMEATAPLKTMFYCKLKPVKDIPSEVICLNSVAVGYPPLDVSEFSCISYELQNLTCSWKQRPNPLKTKYKIYFHVGGRSGSRSRVGCPDSTSDILHDTCTWTLHTDPQYRLVHETYYFILEGYNDLTNKNETFLHKFNHFAHVIPPKAENLKVKEKTQYSATIEWNLAYTIANFEPGLILRVEYLPQWEAHKSWQRVNTSGVLKSPKKVDIKSDPTKHELNITSLKYANTWYDIRVYLKSAKANESDDSLWSAPAAVTVKTRPDLPGSPPRTDIGSFEVFNRVDDRDIYVYWQTIPDYLQNGDNFNYKIINVEVDGVAATKEPSELTKKYAKFSKVDRDKSLRLQIASANTEGLSRNKSEIHIPPRYQVPSGPVSVTKVFYENGMYELSWKPPTMGEENVSSYTIFWCDSIYDHMCSGYLNWTRVPSNITIRNMTVEDDKPYQFAVSANTDVASSGMVWASCTILYNKPIQRMKNVWVKKVTSTYMELAWNLDCSDRNGLVTGFKIYYCPVQHKGPECKSARQNITIVDPQQSAGNLTGLRPYTTYSVAVAVLSNGGESLPSEPLLNVTLEAAPTPPLNVSIMNITNTTITISWNAPEERNGVITKYEVHYDGKVQTKNNDNNNKQTLVLENLTSYYNYSISVAACTIACSDKSPPLTAETKVGEPGIMNAPHVTFLNQSLLSVKWDPPARPSGLLDYYEIKISYPGNVNATDELIVTSNTSHTVRISGCSEMHHPYSFAVRAVNVDPNSGVHYRGQWSNPGEGSCYTSDLPEYQIIIIAIFGVAFIIIFICGLIHVGKKIWYKCKDMRDVEVKLPPGIVLPLEPDRDQDFKMHQWLSHNHHDAKPPHAHGLSAAADEERLLQQKDDHHHDRNLSGDSSGCSSGHESVSSATDGTRVSSDSGTEADRNEQGFSEPTWEAGSGSDSMSASAGKQQANNDWEDAYTFVGAKVGLEQAPGCKGASASVRSTPNLTDLEPAYTVMSLASWASSGTIPEKTNGLTNGHTVAHGYVPLDHVPPPTSKHPPPSLMWEGPEGYVHTGTSPGPNLKEAFTPECEGSWEEPLRLHHQSRSGSGGYVKAGECGQSASRTEPLGPLSSIMAGGYVMAGDNGLGRIKAKPLVLPRPLVLPLVTSPQGHEYVLTGERTLPASSRPLVHLDAAPPKPYCRVSERDRPLPPPTFPASASTSASTSASSGYVPHRQLE